jgi:hypothetical protein
MSAKGAKRTLIKRAWCRQKCLLRSVGIDEAGIQAIARAADDAGVREKMAAGVVKRDS